MSATIQANEILYTALNLLTLLASLWSLVDYVRDWRALVRRDLNMLRLATDDARREVAVSAIWNEAFRACVTASFALVGLLSMRTVPSPSPGAAMSRAVFVTIAFGLALIALAATIKDRRARAAVVAELAGAQGVSAVRAETLVRRSNPLQAGDVWEAIEHLLAVDLSDAAAATITLRRGETVVLTREGYVYLPGGPGGAR